MTGGAVTSSDGKLALSIPAGAVGSNVTITTEPATPPAAGAVGTVYEIGPSGTQFAMPVTLTLHYAAADVSRHGGVVAARRDVRGRILAAAAGRGRRHAGQDGLGRDHAPVAIRDRHRGGGQDVRDRAAPPIPAPLPAPARAAAARPCCTPPTCAGATDACGQYPGSAMDSCIDGARATPLRAASRRTRRSASASARAPVATIPARALVAAAAAPRAARLRPAARPPPTRAPAIRARRCRAAPTPRTATRAAAASRPMRRCVSASRSSACVPAPRRGGGSGCSSPPPRCADGPACARFAGATVQSCTDTENGYKATCCFAVGSLPAPSAGSAAASEAG